MSSECAEQSSRGSLLGSSSNLNGRSLAYVVAPPYPAVLTSGSRQCQFVEPDFKRFGSMLHPIRIFVAEEAVRASVVGFPKLKSRLLQFSAPAVDESD